MRVEKNQCTNFLNVKKPPLFINIPSETLVFSITPPPVLHIILGIFNCIWKNIENISEEHQNICKEFAIRHTFNVQTLPLKVKIFIFATAK